MLISGISEGVNSGCTQLTDTQLLIGATLDLFQAGIEHISEAVPKNVEGKNS